MAGPTAGILPRQSFAIARDVKPSVWAARIFLICVVPVWHAHCCADMGRIDNGGNQRQMRRLGWSSRDQHGRWGFVPRRCPEKPASLSLGRLTSRYNSREHLLQYGGIKMNCKRFDGGRLLAAFVIVCALAARLPAGVFTTALSHHGGPTHYELHYAVQASRSFDEVVWTDGAIVRFDIADGTVRSFLASDNHNGFWAHEATSAGFYEISDRPQLDRALRFVGMTSSVLNALAAGFGGTDSALGTHGGGHGKNSGAAAPLRDRRAGGAFGKLNALARAGLKHWRNTDRSRGAGKGGSQVGGGAGGDSAQPIVGDDETTQPGAPDTSGDPAVPPLENTVEAEQPVIAIPISEVNGLPAIGGETPIQPGPLPIIDEISTDGLGSAGSAPIVTIDQAAQVVPEAGSFIVWLLGLVTFGYFTARRRSRH